MAPKGVLLPHVSKRGCFGLKTGDETPLHLIISYRSLILNVAFLKMARLMHKNENYELSNCRDRAKIHLLLPFLPF